LNEISCNYGLFLNYFNYYQQQISTDQIRSNVNVNVIHDSKLCFLNTCSIFDSSVWHHDDKSILWNYHLNYMAWLGDLLNLDIINRQYINKKYIVNVILKWIKNKSKVSSKPYPTSLRLLTWTQILVYYKIDNEIIIDSLVEQYVDLKSSIEFELDGNHVLENYISLYLVASFLKLDDDLYYYSEKLSSEVSRQFDMNGFHYERSFAYHFSIIERLFVISEISSGELQMKLRMILNKSYQILMQFCNPEGLPLFHDASHDMYRDKSYLECLLKKYSKGANIDFSIESNYLTLRNNVARLIIDVGDVVPAYQPAHYHCSMTSYTLSVNNKPFIIDTGVHGYYEDKQKRLHSRKTSSHNVLGIDNAEQSNIWSIFRLGKSAFIQTKEIIQSHSCEVVTIKYTAFPSLGWIECTRVIIFSLEFFGVIVADIAPSFQGKMNSHVVIDPLFDIIETNSSILIIDDEQKYKVNSPNFTKLISHDIFKKMGQTEQTSKITFSNSKNDNANNFCTSYSIVGEEVDFVFNISENQIIVSNGLIVDLV
jgi:hypothetical protein